MTFPRSRQWMASWVLSFLMAWPCAAQGEDPLAAVEELIISSRYAEAKAAADEAQRLYKKKGDRHSQALCIYLRAAAELETEDFAAAAIDFETSATMLATAGDRYSAWMALGHLATLERLRRRPMEALARFEQALAHLRAIEASAEPFPLQGPKRLPKLFGISSANFNLLQTRPQAGKAALLRVAEAKTRTAVVATLLDADRLEEAEAELKRLAELSRSLGGVVDGEIEIFRGSLLQGQGQLDAAREIFVKILDEPTTAAEREKGSILEALTEIEIGSGRLEEALAWNDKALVLARSAGASKEEAEVLMLRAEILQRSRRIEAARETFNQVLAAVQRSGSVYQQAVVHERLGKLELDADRHEKAAAHFETAARFLRALDRPQDEAAVWLRLASIYARLGSHAAANSALAEARTLSKKSGSRLLEGVTDLLSATQTVDTAEMEKGLLALLALPENQGKQRAREGAELLGMIEDLEKVLAVERSGAGPIAAGVDPSEMQDAAGKQLMRALALFQENKFAAARDLLQGELAKASSREAMIPLQALIGVSFALEWKADEAIDYLARAAAGIEQTAEDSQIEEFLAAAFQGSNQGVFSTLIELLILQGRSVEAFDYSERARARAFLLGLGNRRLQPRDGADPNLVADAELLRKQIIDLERESISASITDRDQVSSSLREARERLKALSVRLKVTNPSYSARTGAAPLQLKALQTELPPATTLISYYDTGFQVHAWVVESGTFQHFTLPLRSKDLPSAVCWADKVGHHGGDRGVQKIGTACADGAARSEHHYAQLFAPLARHIRHRRLILVPHGALHYVPFAALRNPETGRYLIEDFTLAYAPSASVLPLLRARQTPVEGRALVLGAPEELDPTLRSLPAAQQEAKTVARLFGTRPLLGREATESRLYTLAGKVDLLHVAAHGEYEPRNSLFSRIVLAPGRDHDGNLEVHEISSDLDLSGVNLVVLSACETARGERSGGDEITGLTRALLSAGAPAVIATLWKIDDEASAVLMKEFYRRLLKGTSAAEALREAQLSLLRRPRYGDPYYWAAFNLTGDPQGRWGQE